MNRVIRKSRMNSSAEAKDLLGSLFATELLAPSRCLWLVSPWISDVEVLDNTSGGFPPLAAFGRRGGRLAHVLTVLACAGAQIVVATTTDPKNDAFRSRLDTLAWENRCMDRIRFVIDPSRELHTKALTGDDFALVGSMNITRSGIELREEFVELRTEPEFVAQARIDSYERFGGVL